MTVEEYGQTLDGLTDEQFNSFRQSWGGTKATREECVQEFAYTTDPLQWERIIIFRLRQLGVAELRTESEKVLETARDSAAAAKDSARAADKSATSAQQSARLSLWTVILAGIAIVVSVVQACSGNGGVSE